METKNISIVIFYDNDIIFLQERGNHSKYGEKYGFWGGGVEVNETPSDAIKRELLEELSYKPRVLDFWKDYSFNDKNTLITLHIFLSPITKELQSSKVLEGQKLVRFSVSQILLSEDFDNIDKEIIKRFQTFLHKKSK